jgi:hypothetical protein
MVDFYADFILRTLTLVLEQVVLDYVQVAEDMAYKLHSMISPAMARRFFLWRVLSARAKIILLSLYRSDCFQHEFFC